MKQRSNPIQSPSLLAIIIIFAKLPLMTIHYGDMVCITLVTVAFGTNCSFRFGPPRLSSRKKPLQLPRCRSPTCPHRASTATAPVPLQFVVKVTSVGLRSRKKKWATSARRRFCRRPGSERVSPLQWRTLLSMRCGHSDSVRTGLHPSLSWYSISLLTSITIGCTTTRWRWHRRSCMVIASNTTLFFPM